MLLLLAIGCGAPAEATEPDAAPVPAAYVESVLCGPEHLDRSLDLLTETPFGLQVWACEEGCTETHSRWSVDGQTLTVSCDQEIRYEARWLIVGS